MHVIISKLDFHFMSVIEKFIKENMRTELEKLTTVRPLEFPIIED